jgi:flagellar motor switch protein FliM
LNIDTSQPLLSQDELAALSAGLPQSASEHEGGYNVDMSAPRHDLASEDSSLGVNVASLDMINERFIRLFRLGMLELLRTSPRLSPSRVQIIRFGDYLKNLKLPLSVNTLRMSPLRGQSMIIIEPGVIFSSLDSFFGGFGKGVAQLSPGRLFTPTETRIINLILQVFFKSMKEAWSPIASVEFDPVGSEINPQFAQIADENDLVVLSRFESDAGAEAANGFIDLVIPYVSLKPVRDLLRSRVQTGDGNDDSDMVWRAELTAAVDEACVSMQVLLGEIDLTLQQVQALNPGEILYFKRPELARARICGIPVYEVEVGAAGQQVAVRIARSITHEAH